MNYSMITDTNPQHFAPLTEGLTAMELTNDYQK